MSIRRSKLFAFILIFVLAIPFFTGVREVHAASQIIKKVVIEGSKRVPEETIRSRIKSRAGLIYSQTVVKQDVKSLYDLGHFSDIVVDLDQYPDGVVLKYIIEEKPIISKIEFEGNRKLKDDDLRNEITVSPYGPVNERELAQSMEKIREAYAQKGYYLAEVNTRLDTAPDGDNILVFDIRENEGVQVRRIDFVGNKAFSDKKLRGVVRTKKKGAFSFLTGSGKYKEEQLRQDMLLLTFHYLNHGYLRVKVQPPRVTISKDKRYIFITFNVNEGKQYRVGNLSMSGDILTTEEELLSYMKLKKGDIYSQKNLEEDVLMLTDRYGDQGYAFANIIPDTIPDDENLTADIDFKIRKGDIIQVERINIFGNMTTRDKVIRREMKIKENDRYSERLIRESRQKIMALGYFEEVNFATPRGTRDDRVVLNVTVKERPTGSFNIGAGFSSAEKFIFNASVQKENAFGYGISAQVAAELSKIRQMFMLSVHDPYFLDTNWMLGGSVYRSVYRYVDFRRKALGGDINVGRRFLDHWSLTMGYKIEDVQVDDFSFAVPQLFRGNASGLTSAVTMSLAHDTRDNRLIPTKGTYNIVTTELSGAKLGGDNDYFRVNYRSMFYQPLYKSIIFKLFGRIGYIRSLNDQPVPLYERFFTGGVYSLRGYSPNAVGPKIRIPGGPGGGETDFVYGGDKLLLFVAEMEFPIYDPAGLRWVVFFDAGNAFSESENYSLINMKTDAGFGLRWNSPMGPLRFEWGFPINPDPGDAPVVFNFTVGSFF